MHCWSFEEGNRLLTAISDAIVVLDPNFNITYINPAAVRLLLLSAETAIGTDVSKYIQLMHSRQPLDLKKLLSTCLDQTKEQIIKRGTELVTQEGKILLIEGNLSPVIESEQAEQATEIIFSFRDVGDQIRLERSMTKTEKMTSLSILAAGMAHEINNPLSGTLLALNNIKRALKETHPKNQLVAERCGADLVIINKYLQERGIKHLLDNISSVSVRAAKIVKDILMLGSMNEHTIKPMSLAVLIHGAVSVVANEFSEDDQFHFEKIHFHYELDDLEEIPCEPAEMARVLHIILKNAVQALSNKEKGKSRDITITAKKQQSGVVLEIKDNGKGMTEDVQQHAFNPFFTTNPVHSGLGLFVVYFIIVEVHHGTIELKSQLNQGTSCIIWLPMG